MNTAKSQKGHDTKMLIVFAIAIVIAFCIAGFYFLSQQNAQMAADEAASTCNRFSNIAIRLDELDLAHLPDCERAAKLNPNNANALFQYGRILEKAGQPTQAFDSYLAAYHLGNHFAANTIGTLYLLDIDKKSVFFQRKDNYACHGDVDCAAKALHFFQIADNGTNALAAYNVGYTVYNYPAVLDRNNKGACIPKSPCFSKAYDAFLRAAGLGFQDATLAVSLLLAANASVPDDTQRDTNLCATRTACIYQAIANVYDLARNGVTQAQISLGNLYANEDSIVRGEKVPGCVTKAKCQAIARDWYRLAAPNSPNVQDKITALGKP